ncbi:MAG: hypothetical protein ACXWC0_28105 [Burkholderiales bacterium]
MKRLPKVLLYACLSALGLCLLTAVGFYFLLRYECNLPPERRVREEFASNRSDYIRLVTLLKEDHTARFIDRSGNVDIDGLHSRRVPEYGHLIRRIGAKQVLIREDGSIEFTLWGFGCTICSDSYMGVRYVPKDHKRDSPAGWEQTVVTSLDSAKLPQEKGVVATGLYVVPIEPDWFIYRFEYQE